MKILALCLTLLVLRCGSQPPTPPPPQPDTNLCEAAEQNIERLQCKDRLGNPMWINKRGERFKVMCEQVQTEGGVFLNPKCASEATTCKEVNQCPAQ